jgi:hypothetical protein
LAIVSVIAGSWRLLASFLHRHFRLMEALTLRRPVKQFEIQISAAQISSLAGLGKSPQVDQKLIKKLP